MPNCLTLPRLVSVIFIAQLGLASHAVTDEPIVQVMAIEGKVVKTASRWVTHSKLIVTDVTVAVERTSTSLPLPSNRLLTFTAPGGELPARNMRMTINNIPVFKAGQPVLVSLDSPDKSDHRYRYRAHLTPGGFSQ